jgi:hypothetical protein
MFVTVFSHSLLTNKMARKNKNIMGKPVLSIKGRPGLQVYTFTLKMTSN